MSLDSEERTVNLTLILKYLHKNSQGISWIKRQDLIETFDFQKLKEERGEDESENNWRLYEILEILIKENN